MVKFCGPCPAKGSCVQEIAGYDYYPHENSANSQQRVDTYAGFVDTDNGVSELIRLPNGYPQVKPGDLDNNFRGVGNYLFTRIGHCERPDIALKNGLCEALGSLATEVNAGLWYGGNRIDLQAIIRRQVKNRPGF